MATREPVEDQGGHEAGDESYPDKYTIDNRHDKSHVDGGHHGIEAETDNDERHSNGQAATETNNALDHSTDTTTTTTTTSTTTTSPTSASEQSATNSPSQQSLLPQQDATLTTSDDSEAAAETAKTTTTSSSPAAATTTTTKDITHQGVGHDEDDGDDELEEGELKDDDDDDDDDNDDNVIADKSNNRFSKFNNDNNDDNNNSGLKKESSYSDQRLHHDTNSSNNPSNFSASRGGQAPYHHHQHQQHRRHHSPNAPQHHPDMHAQFPQNHLHFGNNSNNNNHYRFQPNNDGGTGPPMPGMLPHMDHHPMAGPAGVYPRGGPGAVGPMQKVNARCRFYSKTSNKCTWGDHCRFEHRDDSPGPGDVFDNRLPLPGMVPQSNRGPPPPPPMGAADRNYPPYSGRYQPYPPPPPPPHPYGYGPYEQPPYGPHHSTSPPLPPHSMPPHHWRQQHSPYPPSSSSAHPPESVSPALMSNPGSGSVPPNSGGKQPLPSGGSSVPPALSSGGAPSPGYSSPSSSAVYERKHRLAYELAPWNDRGYPANKYDRGEPPSGYPPSGGRGSFYRNHYNRDPYGREPPLPPHMGGPTHSYPSGYPPNYPSAYRGGPMGPHASHYRYSSSSQRTVPPYTRRSRSNKRGHDEDESSWSDSGSEDSILGQASSSSKSKISKKQHHQRPVQATTENTSPKDPLDQGGSGTPPGEPLPEDRERQEMLLNKLKEIEDLMAKKKGEQEDPM